jgi:flagellar motility protein MotE (MotC chaperone)
MLILLAALPLLLGADSGEVVEEPPGPPPAPVPWEQPRAEDGACADEEILVLRDLRQRSLELDRREAELDERVAALASLEEEAAVELERLSTMRDAIVELMQQQQAGSQERIASLARVVDTMKASEAAAMLGGMDEDVALQVLRKIKPKQAGKVLGAMPDKKAQQLGDRMTVVPDPREAS